MVEAISCASLFSQFFSPCAIGGPTDDVPLKYTVTIRGIYTTVEKGKVTLIDDHSPHPCMRSLVDVLVSISSTSSKRSGCESLCFSKSYTSHAPTYVLSHRAFRERTYSR
jgi:hypothetical protein